MKLSKLLIVPVILGSILYGLGMATITNADTVTVTATSPADCEYVDGNVVCQVTRLQGIKSIDVHMDSGIGPIGVFEQSYKGCPTSVEIVLDPIVIAENSDIDVETCGPAFDIQPTTKP